MRPRLLIVDDEKNTREVLGRFLKEQYDVTLAEDGAKGLAALKSGDFDVVLTDLRMPGADGIEILERALEKDPPAPCIVFTAYGSIESAVDAMRKGAFDFVAKPINFEQLEILLKRALESKRLKQENQELRRRLDSKYGMENMIGQSAAMHDVFETVKQVAPTSATVLISGESGTGKELIAQSIHQLSGRKGRFLPVHCAALPASLLESELFGHERGAFTGAVEQKKGRFELADKGTLFLDEIGEIEPQVQVKLLRVLETSAFERLGSMETIKVDSRVVAATNKDLMEMVRQDKFREDLFYRLDVVQINIPPLRSRQEDIPLFVKHYIDEFSKKNNKSASSISEEALGMLCSYDWPGNVRELRNCIERMVVLSKNDILNAHDVPTAIKLKTGVLGGSHVPASSLDLTKNERHLILKALSECEGNRTRAAEKLGISRRTLHRKINEFKIAE